MASTGTYEDLKGLLLRIESLVDSLYNRIHASHIVTIGGLSDIDNNIGLINSGEFRAGNNVYPGDGFTGIRVGYPAFSYGGEDWNIVGINDDVLQFGVRASDGQLLAGGGNVRLGADGLFLRDGTDSEQYIKWEEADSTVIGRINTEAEAGFNTLTIRAIGTDAQAADGLVSIFPIDKDSNATELQIFTGTRKLILQGTFGNLFEINTSTGIVFNEDSTDIDFRVEGANVTDVLEVDAGLDQILAGTTIAIKERADQQADIAGYGQLWVKNTTPCELWFTDDTGTDTQLA